MIRINNTPSTVAKVVGITTPMHDFVSYRGISVCTLDINQKVEVYCQIALIWKLTYLWELIIMLALTKKNDNLENGFAQMLHIISETITPTAMTWPKRGTKLPSFPYPVPLFNFFSNFGMDFMFL